MYYDGLTVAQLKNAALLGDAKAISDVSELFNEVFHKDDPFYPDGVAATILPEAKAHKEEDEPKRVAGPSDDEKRSEERYDSFGYWLERILGCGDRLE